MLTGSPRDSEPDRILATVLFTDIAGSNEQAAALGDRRWRELLEQHHAMVRRKLSEYRGREIETAGDGFLMSFDGPARGVRCANAVKDLVAGSGLRFADHGTHSLKGVPGEWQMYVHAGA